MTKIKTVKEKQSELKSKLKEKFGFKNDNQVPKLEKIVVSVGIGKIKDDKRKIELIGDRLEKITGQKPVIIKAKKSIAQFKVREGQNSGYKVTLRGFAMFNFLDKFINLTLPRSKDFRGIDPKSVDDMGNLTIGVKEHIIFPETGDEEIRDIFGLSVTINTTAKNREVAKEFFELLGVPFKK